jgi:hypothetical protein
MLDFGELAVQEAGDGMDFPLTRTARKAGMKPARPAMNVSTSVEEPLYLYRIYCLSFQQWANSFRV